MEHHSSAEIGDRLACRDTTLRFFRLLDAGDNESCVAQFAPEGTWVRGSQPLQGQAAIGRALAERPAQRRTCHLVTNIEVQVLGDQEAQVTFCLTAYEGVPEHPGGHVTGRLAGIRRCVDRLVRHDGAWLIQHKSSQAVFDAVEGGVK